MVGKILYKRGNTNAVLDTVAKIRSTQACRLSQLVDTYLRTLQYIKSQKSAYHKIHLFFRRVIKIVVQINNQFFYT